MLTLFLTAFFFYQNYNLWPGEALLFNAYGRSEVLFIQKINCKCFTNYFVNNMHFEAVDDLNTGKIIN